MLYETIKIQGNTIVMVPSETLNSMGFGNLGMTVAYLKILKKQQLLRNKKKIKIKIQNDGCKYNFSNKRFGFNKHSKN